MLDNLPDPSTLKSIRDCRDALFYLDVTIPHSVKDQKGRWDSFSIEMLKTHYSNRRDHMLAKPKTELWWAGVHPSDERACAKHAIFFWYNLDDARSLPYAIMKGFWASLYYVCMYVPGARWL